MIFDLKHLLPRALDAAIAAGGEAHVLLVAGERVDGNGAVLGPHEMRVRGVVGKVVVVCCRKREMQHALVVRLRLAGTAIHIYKYHIDIYSYRYMCIYMYIYIHLHIKCGFEGSLAK